MNYLKKSVFFLCFISSFFIVSAQGISTSTIIKSVPIKNPYLATFVQEDYNFNISFNVSNQVAGHPFIKYSVVLFSEESNGKKNIINDYSYEKIVKTKLDKLVFKDVLYRVPPDLKGDFKLAIVLKNDIGSIISVVEIGKIKLVDLTPVEVIPNSDLSSKVFNNFLYLFKIILIAVVILLVFVFVYRIYRSKINKTTITVLLFVILTSIFLAPTNIAHAYSFGILEGVLPPQNPPCGFDPPPGSFANCFSTYNGPAMGTVTFSLNKTSFQPGEMIQISSSIQSNVAGGYYQDFSLGCGIYTSLVLTSPLDPAAFISPCTPDPGIPGSLTAVRYISGMPTNYVGGRGPINIVNAVASPIAPIVPGTYYLYFDAWSGYPTSNGTYILPFTVVSATPAPTVNLWFSFLNTVKSLFSGMAPSKVFAKE